MNTEKSSSRSEISLPIARVVATINAPIATAFTYIQPIPLSSIFPGYNSIPAIVKTNEPEYWTKAGLSRTVTFADGNSANETMKYVDFPNYFSYELQNFTSETLSGLIEKVNGSWSFVSLEENKVIIEWKYVITPRTEEAKYIIQEHILPEFQGMLEQAMRLCKEQLEARNS